MFKQIIFAVLLAFVVADEASGATKRAVVTNYAIPYAASYAAPYTAPYAPFAYSAGYTGYPYYSRAYAYADGTYKAPAFPYAAYTGFY